LFKARTAAAFAALIALAFVGTPAGAVDSIYTEQGKLIRAGEAVGTLGADLFGDKVNLYTGTVEFIQNDVSLPGNNNLPVSVSRRLVTGGESITNRGDRAFGDWELEIPHMHGVYAASAGWKTNTLSNLRCSGFSVAPTVIGTSGPSLWAGDEYWHGHFMYVPGAGSQEVLTRASNNPNYPNDGRSWPLVTKNLWAIGCLGTMKRGVGEGFIAISPDGTQYQFDWMVSRPHQAATKSSRLPEIGTAPGTGATASRIQGLSDLAQTSSQMMARPVGPDGTSNIVVGGLLNRVEVWIMPSRVTDRHGNTVDYTYSSTEPWKLQSIVSSDGRSITFNYLANTQRISSVSDGTRTWSYSYHSHAVGMMLDRVTLPDNTFWQFNADQLSASKGLYLGPPDCDQEGGVDATPATGTMTHPSGALGSFTLVATSHSKSFVQRLCRSDQGAEVSAYYPRYFAHKSLTNKTITGPGLPGMAWNYAYSPAANSASWNTCTGTCPETKNVSVTDPRGYVTRYTFGNRDSVTEGQLQRVDAGWNGSTALRTTITRFRNPAAGPYPDRAGFSLLSRGNGYMASRHNPEDQRVITQQGVNFTWEASGFDVKARPGTVARYSSLGSSRTETTAYYDHTAKWVLGQISTVTETSTGKQPVLNGYDANTANLISTYKFGALQSVMTYYPDGTLWTRADGLYQTTTFSNYWRGLARNAQYADGRTESATIDNRGLITSVTDANNFTTNYGYDTIGRLNLITRPAGDTVAWNTTSMAFEPVSADEYGLSTGHWRQTISTGNARTINYFDALWRPRLTRTFDAANEANTAKTILRNFDADNRKVFESYAARTIGSINATPVGTSTAFDGLGRPINTFADSELGLLSTTTQYLGGFQKRVTNARGFATTTAYQVFDEPSESAITSIVAPEGVSVAIARDVFGTPLGITRSGAYYGSGPASVTRSYVYDANQRLCKTIEPETGATIEVHDAANNVIWRASGQNLMSTTSCDTASVPAASKIAYTYDARNRLTGTGFGDGSSSIGRSYTPDGLPEVVTSNGTTWYYYYNKRRLLYQETLNFDGSQYWGIGRDYNANGHLSQIRYPDGGAVPYAPNALGEATQAGGYAYGVSYHPNGAVAGYTLGNGVVHSLTQNTRGLPLLNRDAGVMQDLYAFDANGNVNAITDQQEGVSTRSMGYDGLDRLTAANAPNVWGTASYGYDALDNLRTSVVGGRTSWHNYDAVNRLGSINTNGAYTSYYYDTRGNITGRGTQGFYFDLGNRMTLANGVASYIYDGHGRRTSTINAGGGYRKLAYSQGGQLLFGQTSQAMTVRNVRYVYIGTKLIAEDGTAGVNYLHTDALGSPVARTNSGAGLLLRTRYEPYGKTAAGTVPEGIGFTGHVNDPDTGLVYMQQRYYDPVAGRFLSLDPVVTDANTGKSFNRYDYANNNPFKYVDPDGRVPILIPVAIGALSGAIGAMRDPNASRGKIALAAAGGAVAGLVSAVAIVGGTAATVAGQLFTAGSVGNALGQMVGDHKTPPNAAQVVTQGALSVVGGGAGLAASAMVKGAATVAQTASVGATVSTAVSTVANTVVPQKLGGMAANKETSSTPVESK
jgi:RHS repeat-associated protein